MGRVTYPHREKHPARALPLKMLSPRHRATGHQWVLTIHAQNASGGHSQTEKPNSEDPADSRADILREKPGACSVNLVGKDVERRRRA